MYGRTHFLAVVLLLGLTGSLTGAGYQASGLSFLQVNPDSRIMALGDAGVALGQNGGAGVLLLNPGIISDNGAMDAQLAHTIWFARTGLEFAGITFPASRGQYGLTLTSANINNFELRGTQASDEPIGEFGAHYARAGFSGARNLSGNTAVGVGIDLVYEQIYYHTAHGVSFSLGAQHRISPDLRIGAAINHLGSMTKLIRESTPLPTSARLGLVFNGHIDEIELDYTFAADAGYFLNSYGFIGGGYEVCAWKIAAFRAGAQLRGDQLHTSFGLGIHWKKVTLDYGTILDNNQLGLPHLFSLHFML